MMNDEGEVNPINNNNGSSVGSNINEQIISSLITQSVTGKGEGNEDKYEFFLKQRNRHFALFFQ